jgi:transcriptional regulator with XRE-family HTH domain
MDSRINYLAIGAALKKKLMSQMEIATATRCSANTIASIMKGKAVRLDSLRRVLEFLGFTAEDNPFISQD